MLSKLDGLEQQVQALNPLAILERGYAVLSQVKGPVIQSVKQVTSGDQVKIRVKDGTLGAVVDDVENGK